MTAREFYRKCMATAVRNTVDRTQVGVSVVIYLVVGLIVSLGIYLLWYGFEAAAEQWKSGVVFAILGPVVAWFIVFTACCVSAPFQVLTEEIARHLGDTAYLMETKNALTAERDNLLAEKDATPADRGDIAELSVALSREGQDVYEAGIDNWGDCNPWFTKSCQFVRMAFRSNIARDFEAMATGNIQLQHEPKQRVHANMRDCISFLRDCGNPEKLRSEWIKPGLKRSQFVAISTSELG